MYVTLPDQSQLEVADGATGLDVARTIGEGLARAAVAVEVDGDVHDLRAPVADGARVAVITQRDERALEVLRHSAAHLMAEAVVNLFPGTKVSIGPAIEDGFYYDFDFPEPIGEADLERIEEEMRRLVKEGRQWERWEVDRDEAVDYFRERDETYKVELVEAIPQGETVTFYRQGGFTDLCRGPHLQDASPMKAIKLMSLAGAYWRGDSNNRMLTRIYGTAFFSKQDLEEHLDRIERAKKNDHRKLGTELDLFSFQEESPGSPFWHPRGMVVWNAISELWREQHGARGYQEVKTPILFSPDLWKASGHWENYKDNMFLTEVEGREFGLKPMNCPAHGLIVKSDIRSYRDLPIRLCEQGLVHRNEPSGTLHGLMRVRHITQDDAHIFCAPEQILDEVVGVLDFVLELYRLFGFDDYRMELSTRPEKSLGTAEMWEKAETALAEALVRKGIEYDLNPGDGAFYGPKIDFHIRDSMGRSWQCGTCQLDFGMAERLGLHYTGEDNAEHEMVVIHRALLGSMERFLGILVEHYEGAFPVWLAPVQAQVIPVADRHNDYAQRVAAELRAAGLRPHVDARSESIGRKIAEARNQRVPAMAVVGDREVESGEVTVRRRGSDEQVGMGIAEFVTALADEDRERRLAPVVAEASA